MKQLAGRSFVSGQSRFLPHVSMQAFPLGGGLLTAQGTVWVAPEAESHPEALHMQVGLWDF